MKSFADTLDDKWKLSIPTASWYRFTFSQKELNHYQTMSSLTRSILYAAAADLSHLVYSEEEERPIYEGRLSARLVRLKHSLHSYDLLLR